MKKHILCIVALLLVLLLVACSGEDYSHTQKPIEKDNPEIDSETAHEYMWALQDYGDYDIYFQIIEDMDREILDEYVYETYASDFEEVYNIGREKGYEAGEEEGYDMGYDVGYEDGFVYGITLIIESMDEQYREKWWNENIDMITENYVHYYIEH